jgi:acetyltransferase-like isoleucine patch superfamily enzyme
MPLLRGLLLRPRLDAGSRVRVRGRIRINRPGSRTRLALGRGVLLYEGVHFFLEADGAEIEVGDRTYVNRRAEILARQGVRIGADCAIAWDVMISDTDYHSIDDRPDTSRVEIGDGVWIGAGAKVLKGVTVGPGAAVAAGAVVTRDVPPRTLVAGVPARVVREGIAWR